LTENAKRENDGAFSRRVKMHDVQSVPIKGFTTKCARVVKIFRSLARYYHNTTYLLTVKAHSR